MPTTHLSDVSRERAILLYAIMSGPSIDVGWVIFDSYRRCVRQKVGGIVFPSLIMALCAFNGVNWVANEELGPPIKPIDGALIA